MTPKAVLIDVYETALTCDFAAHRGELPRLAGVTEQVWNEAFIDLAGAAGDGRLTMAEAFAEVIRRGGGTPTGGLVADLVQRDCELLISSTRVYDDTVAALRRLRRGGIATAFVSNCAENTRPMLKATGLADLVDHLILSCEVGSSKPDRGIFDAALRALNVEAHDAVLLDDQPTYCDGAEAVGIRGILVDRKGTGAEQALMRAVATW